MAGPTFANTRKLAKARAVEYAIVDNYKYGYRNREDVTNLPPGVLIVGSQNVLTNVSERIQIRQGYAVDGAQSAVEAPVLSSFDWQTKNNGEMHLRAGGLTSAGNDGKLQYRYVADDGTVSWRDLLTGLTTVSYNFTTFWDSTESLRVALFVNGTSNIFEWNGAIAVLDSVDNAAGTIVVLDATPTNGGSGYTTGDILTITTGGTGATATVVTVDMSGTITAVSLATPGQGYTTGTGKSTSGGTGTSATLDITTVGTGKIKVSGTTSPLDLGFYTSNNMNIVINGTTYAYTALVGQYFVDISPSAAAEPVDSIIHQAVVTTSNSDMSALPHTFPNGLIATMNNQVYIGALTSSAMYLSKVNDYTDYSSSDPRQNGEGGTLILDGNLVAFNVQGAVDAPTMYVSAGQDFWYKITFTDFVSSTGASGQTLGSLPIKTGRRQGARSQAFVSSMKNNTITVTYEPTIDQIGVMENFLTQIQTVNISDPIKLDVDSYDFTDGSIFYWRYFILVAIPKEGLIRMYNLATNSWEAPQTIPVSRFYIVDGELYGHSYNTFESYKLFTGYADRVYSGFAGFPIQANWVFSYQNYGSRFTLKSATKLYVEGYINPNTTLTCSLTCDIDGCQTVKTFELDGSDGQFVCLTSSPGSLGKEGLGKQKLGGDIETNDHPGSIQNLPPKFRWFPTFTNTDFFEASIGFSVLGNDERAELLAFGLAVSGSTQLPVQKMD